MYEALLEQRREFGRKGGRVAADRMTPAQRQRRARAGAEGSRSPLAHARAIAKAWDGLPDAERDRVWSELAELLRWAHT